jgi:hypothetical protein
MAENPPGPQVGGEPKLSANLSQCQAEPCLLSIQASLSRDDKASFCITRAIRGGKARRFLVLEFNVGLRDRPHGS